MTRATKMKARRGQAPPPEAGAPLPRGLLFFAALGVVGFIAAGALVWVSRDSGEATFSGIQAPDPGPVHVHGLGVNPADGALFVATHTGLYRVAEGERKAERVGDRYQSLGRTASWAPATPTSTRRARRTCPRCSA
jgi:hypothetical protein